MSSANLIPERMKKGPGRLVTLFNGLRDFVVARDIIAGAGLTVQESKQGRVLAASKTLVELARQYEETRSGATNTPGENPPNIFGGGAGSVPGGTGPTGTTPDGTTGEWVREYKCVSDGAGGWTPISRWVWGASTGA